MKSVLARVAVAVVTDMVVAAAVADMAGMAVAVDDTAGMAAAADGTAMADGMDAVTGAVIATGMADAVMAGAATAATDTAATDGGLVIAFAGGSGVTAGWSRSAAGAAGKAKSESSGASAGAFSLLGVEI